jgi:hypothetical protein
MADKPFDIRQYNDTAYCPVHQELEPFKIIGEPQTSPDSRASLAANNGKLVTIQFLCDNKHQIVTAA